LLADLAWSVADTTRRQARWRIARRFCLSIPYFLNKNNGRSVSEIRAMDRRRTGRFKCASSVGLGNFLMQRRQVRHVLC
jgi:hypothetical protein